MNRDDDTLVSILLPTYNRATLLERCVDSVLAQSYSNWELIISDDGSTDDTPLVAKKIMEKDARIRYHRNSVNQGLPRNRNIAISISRGNLIFFIEDDLILEPDCLEKLLEAFKSLEYKNIRVGAITPRLLGGTKKTNVLFSNAFNLVGDSMRKKMSTPYTFNKLTGVSVRNFSIDTGNIQEVGGILACSLYPKNVLKEVGGYSSCYKGFGACEEGDTNLRIKKRGYKFYFQPKAIVHHKRVETGGCSETPSTLSYYYYFLRNNILLLVRGFGWKSLYMIPAFLFFIFLNAVRYSFAILMKKSRNKEG